MTIEPLHDNVAVEVEEKKQTGEFVIPETATDKPQIGTVTAKGGDANKVQVGDRVAFRKYAPDILEIEDTKRFIVREEDILAIIK